MVYNKKQGNVEGDKVIEKTIEEYCEKFNVSGFASAALRGRSDEEIERVLRDCIERNEPFEPEYEEDVIY